ncbi:YgaP family membrane protein [Kaarinaea lacus]
MNHTELSQVERVSRIVIGTGLIVFTMLVNILPLGLFAVLPLIATYPIFSGIYGYDPVTHWIGKEFDHVVHASERLLKSAHTPKHS